MFIVLDQSEAITSLDKIQPLHTDFLTKSLGVNMAEKLSPCGITCATCDAYIATQTGDQALFQKLAEQFKQNFGEDISPDKIRCDGCMNDGAHIGFCFECEIRKCVIEKGHETCAECADFPCAKGQFIWTEVSVS